MNSYDSDLIRHIMSSSGYQAVNAPEDADIILINTCSVRNHAEQRVLGRVSELNRLKQKNPDRLLGVLGCMAQRCGEKILENAPYVDLVMGPGSYRALPGTIDLLADEKQLAVLDNGRHETYEGLAPPAQGKTQVMIPIMRGCNEHCTYCIVPRVRGGERNRSPEDICREVQDALRDDAVEVTLLGQNITAYRHRSADLACILDSVSRMPGLKRLRFLTSHPRHLTEDVIEIMAKRENICHHIHLPVQSGSNRILKLMGRRYTVEDYLRKINTFKNMIPDISISTDLIAGFPGESDGDFEETLLLMKEVVFDDAFTYKYSPRPGTPAARMRNSIDPVESQGRLEELISLQRQHTAGRNHSLIGRSVEVLVEKYSKRGDGEYFGKTSCARNVVFEKDSKEYKPGDLVSVRVSGSTGPTLLGHSIET